MNTWRLFLNCVYNYDNINIKEREDKFLESADKHSDVVEDIYFWLQDGMPLWSDEIYSYAYGLLARTRYYKLGEY